MVNFFLSLHNKHLVPVGQVIQGPIFASHFILDNTQTGKLDFIAVKFAFKPYARAPCEFQLIYTQGTSRRDLHLARARSCHHPGRALTTSPVSATELPRHSKENATWKKVNMQLEI